MPCLKPTNRKDTSANFVVSNPKLETKLLLHKTCEVIWFESLAHFPIIRKEKLETQL